MNWLFTKEAQCSQDCLVPGLQGYSHSTAKITERVTGTATGMSRRCLENPKEALILLAAQRQLSTPPTVQSESRQRVMYSQPSCFQSGSKVHVCQVRRIKNVLGKRFNFPASMGKSTNNGKEHKKHIHERLLFKTSQHSHFQWNLAGCSQYLIQKFLRNEGLLQASFIWPGLGFAFSHIPPAEVRG